MTKEVIRVFADGHTYEFTEKEALSAMMDGLDYVNEMCFDVVDSPTLMKHIDMLQAILHAYMQSRYATEQDDDDTDDTDIDF